MIRRATLADFPRLVALGADVYRDLGDYASILPSWLGHPGVLAYVDEVEDPRGRSVLRGFILIGFYEPLAERPGRVVADLLAIAVAPSYQRQGVGSRLLDYAIRIAQRAVRGGGPVPEMRLTVAETNVAGQSLFTKTGFQVLDPNHGSYDHGQRAIRMTRPLDA